MKRRINSPKSLKIRGLMHLNEFEFHGFRYYIKRTVLQKGLMEYYGHTFSIKDVISALDNAGVLDKEGNSTSKHFKGIRHLVISSSLIKKYYEMKKEGNT